MLKLRLISGLILGVICLVALLFPGVLGAGVFLVVSLSLVWVGFGEFGELAAGAGCPCRSRLLQIFGGLLILVHCLPPLVGWGGCPKTFLELAVLVAFALAGAWLTIAGTDLRATVPQWFATLGGMALIYGTLSCIPRLYFIAGDGMTGRYLVLFLAATTKAADIGAYAAGMLTARRPRGNHKLWPRISPKKSWEGLAGGVVAGIVVAVLLVGILPADVGEIFGAGGIGAGLRSAVLAVVLTFSGLLGDLAESALKRAAGAKDSGRIPGLGGVLDFVDSLLFNAPIFYLFILWRLA